MGLNVCAFAWAQVLFAAAIAYWLMIMMVVLQPVGNWNYVAFFLLLSGAVAVYLFVSVDVRTKVARACVCQSLTTVRRGICSICYLSLLALLSCAVPYSMLHGRCVLA